MVKGWPVSGWSLDGYPGYDYFRIIEYNNNLIYVFRFPPSRFIRHLTKSLYVDEFRAKGLKRRERSHGGGFLKIKTRD